MSLLGGGGGGSLDLIYVWALCFGCLGAAFPLGWVCADLGAVSAGERGSGTPAPL